MLFVVVCLTAKQCSIEGGIYSSVWCGQFFSLSFLCYSTENIEVGKHIEELNIIWFSKLIASNQIEIETVINVVHLEWLQSDFTQKKPWCTSNCMWNVQSKLLHYHFLPSSIQVHLCFFSSVSSASIPQNTTFQSGLHLINRWKFLLQNHKILICDLNITSCWPISICYISAWIVRANQIRTTKNEFPRIFYVHISLPYATAYHITIQHLVSMQPIHCGWKHRHMPHHTNQLNGWINFIIFIRQRLFEFINDEHFRSCSKNVKTEKRMNKIEQINWKDGWAAFLTKWIKNAREIADMANICFEIYSSRCGGGCGRKFRWLYFADKNISIVFCV